jgi:hypothetical protein
LSALAVLVMTALIIIEGMCIVGMYCYYAGRNAKIAPLLAEYERIKEEERARDEGVRDSSETSP